MLTTLDVLMDVGQDEDSLQVENAFAFCAVRAKDLPFLNPSSC